MKRIAGLTGVIVALTLSTLAHAAHAGLLANWSEETGTGVTGVTPGGVSIEVGFSPEGSAEPLVEKAINSAHHSIRLSAYSFTSPDVVRALVAAKRRGVDVAAVVDEKNNLSEDRSGKARQALNLLVNASIPTRTISVYPIHHDKFIVVDGDDVETGSFNYSEAAARRNSENALVIWHDPALAKAYLDHWQSRWAQGQDYRSSY